MPTAIPISTLTEATLDGDGAFDVLMQATKAHLEQEFNKNRIKGSEYATVYLGSLESTMRTALEFTVQGRKIELEAQLLEQKILLTQAEIQKALAELAIIQATVLKVPAEIALLEAQTAQTIQQTLNLISDELLLDAKTAQTAQQTLNLVSDELLIDAKTALTTQQSANAIIEGTVLTAQKCKLDAEYDVLLSQKLKVVGETALLAQKKVTETSQTVEMGVDTNSVVGRQKDLYAAQTSGFTRDAEQKAAKLMVDSWNVRRTTDEGTVADATNMLYDIAVGRAVTKLLDGVQA